MLESLLAPFVALFLLLITFIVVLLAIFTILWVIGKTFLWLLLGMNPKLHRRVAVFGESGSGKTMLLTSFYGHQQAAKFRKANGYSLLAANAHQGTALLNAYFLLENDLLAPGNRFDYSVYDFYFKIEGFKHPVGLVTWYDYPGGWWTESHSGEEQQRKVRLVAQLVRADVGLLLVDGQKFRKDGSYYLKRLFASFRDELSRQQKLAAPDRPPPWKNILGTVSALVLSCQRKLVRYPTIWVICLSKADLFDGYSVEEFRKDVLKEAQAEIQELSEQIKSMTWKPEQVSIGEEFLLLSSAEFDPESNHIKDPKKTIGIDLIAPISLMAPPQHAQRRFHTQYKSAGRLKRWLMAMQRLTVGWMKYLPVVGGVFMAIDDEITELVAKAEAAEGGKLAQGGVLASIVERMHARLIEEDAESVYLGVNNRGD